MPEVQKKAEKGINYKTNFPLLYPALSSWACSGKFIVPSGKSIFGYFECLFVPP
jgi:hypothetical protein